nr:glycoside hydrolase family 36 protein [Herbiconiux sp. VKM Ac-2851]
MASPVPFVEIVTVAAGHDPASGRLDHSQIGAALRYVRHEIEADGDGDGDGDGSLLRIVQRDDVRGLEVTVRLQLLPGTGAVRSTVQVRNTSEKAHALRSVASWSSALGGSGALDGWQLVSGWNEWLGEGRWSTAPLRTEIPTIREDLTGHDRRSFHGQHSSGTWSTGSGIPLAAVESVAQGACWIWQIEHNGGWRWDVAENITGGVVTLSGPTDADHAWLHRLDPGQSFTTVPATVALAPSFPEAVRSLTRHRRAARRPHPDNTELAVVFNDYMNTLDGDPTTERLLPLIDAAADAGAGIFCIDAGWYDDSGSWWGTVGEWRPSTTRFPGGLGEVVDHIRSRGMVPGLWLEPEVVGVRSPMAESLPDDAFLQRLGVRVEEHERYHLDLRHPEVVAFLDSVVDRLVSEFGIGFFKFDYNINPGPGTDVAAASAGDGLLQHNRAHLRWLDGVLDRHPELIVENCASGAMRTDFAMLSRLQMQSTSDQQDFRLYPPIAAAAPLAMLPEQAASWAYPQPSMTDEEIAFCLVTGLLGRYYVSGYLNRMRDEQRSLVRDAIGAAQALRADIAASTPFWPLGLPGWTDRWVALGLTPDAQSDGSGDLVSVWNRGLSDGEPLDLELDLPHLRGQQIVVETVFPRSLPEWSTDWNRERGVLTVSAHARTASARTFRIRH